MANLNFPEVKDRDPNAEVDMEVLNDTIEYIRPAVQADGGDIKLASVENGVVNICLLYTSPSPRDPKTSRMPSSA